MSGSYKREASKWEWWMSRPASSNTYLIHQECQGWCWRHYWQKTSTFDLSAFQHMECLTSKQQQDQTRLVFLCQEFHQHESQMHWLSQHISAFFLETWEPDVLKTDEQNTHFTGHIPMLSISAERVGAKSTLSRKLHVCIYYSANVLTKHRGGGG